MGSNIKSRSASKVALESFDDLFGGSAAQENGVEQIINAPLAELYTFKDHPFRVEDDEKMEETTESIRQYGVLVPGIARPREGGGYEIIAGHRRKRGSELAGKTEMPVVVRNYTDDEATIIMVDSNIQREDILPSEKARAYKMKYEAMKHQGKKSGKNTLDEVGEVAGENAKKVQRYIWLSRLSDELLTMVDGKKLGFSQGVDISFLAEEAQQWVQAVIEEKGCNVSMAQSAKIKEYGKTGELTLAMVRLILTEEKPKERKVTLKADKISEYFAEDCSSEEIEGIIIQLLDEWKKKTIEGRCISVDGTIKFDYYYGIEAEQFSFYRVPRLLIKDARFKELSSDAKLLYGLMLDRLALSIKNGWLDEENRVYIHYTLDNIMEDLGCAREKCAKVIAELDSKKGIGLIEKKRRGLGKPDIIYVKNFATLDTGKEPGGELENPDNADNSAEVRKPNFKRFDNQTSRSSEIELQEIRKLNLQEFGNQTSRGSETELAEVRESNPNYNNTNYTDLSYTNPINQSNRETEKQEPGKLDNGMIDVMDNATAYMEIIRDNIEYEHHMKYGDWQDKGLYEELYEVICEIVCVKRKAVKVNGEDYPYELVKSKFLKLNSSHLEYVIGCMRETTTKIANIRAYMVTALYNAPNTMNHYYQQLVQHDMYGGGWEEKGMFQPKAEGDG